MQDPKEQAFYKTVPEAFGYLSQYGFSLQKGEFGNYTATSEKCFIEIALDWEGINITLGPNNVNRSRFQTKPQTIELHHVLRYLNVPVTNEPHYTRSSFGAQEAVSEIRRRAELLQHYCVPLLIGDFSEWQNIEASADAWVKKNFPFLQKEEKDEQQLNKHLNTVRRMAEKSWQEKKYEAVVFLYRNIREHLTSEELKRLEFAYQQIQPNDNKGNE